MNRFSTRQLIDFASALDTVVCASVGLQPGSSSLPSIMVKLDKGRPKALIQWLDMILRAVEEVMEKESRGADC